MPLPQMARHSAHARVRVFDTGSVTRDDVHASFQDLHEGHDIVRRLREVALHDDRTVTLRIRRFVPHMAEKFLDRATVPDTLLRAENRERDRSPISVENLSRIIAGRIVMYDDPVVPTKFADRLPRLP